MKFYHKFVDKFQDIQKERILLSPRQKSSSYLEPSKENIFGEYDAATLTMLYLKVLRDIISEIFKLIFQMQPSCLRNICTENWRKLPNLTGFLEIFLYLKNNSSVEYV